MSDVPQGPGWWQASDDKWYPPPRPAVPSDAQPSPLQGSPVAGAPAGPPTAPTAQAPAASIPVGPTHAGHGGPAQASPPPAAAPWAQQQHHTPPPSAATSPPGGMAAPTSSPGLTPSGPPSPHDLPPVGRPAGSGSDRPLGLYAVLAVLVVAMLVGLVALVSDDGEGATGSSTTTSASSSTTDSTTDTTTDDSTTTTDDTTDTTAATNGGGEVVAVEQGVSSYEDRILEAETYSWGVIVENRGDQVAYNTTVVVGFINDEGDVVDSSEVVINLLIPGQRLGFGDAPYEEVSGVVELDVTVEPPSEWRDPEGYSEITTSDIDVTYDSSDSPEVSFEAENPYDQRIENVMAYCILRNAAGDIVGGGGTTDVPYLPENGTISGSIDLFTAVPDVDAAKTEVYVDPMGLS